MVSSTALALQGVSGGYRQIDGVEQFALLVAERSEPGGAVALAAVLAGKIQTKAVTAVTLSGGNVDKELFAQLLAQAA